MSMETVTTLFLIILFVNLGVFISCMIIMIKNNEITELHQEITRELYQGFKQFRLYQKINDSTLVDITLGNGYRVDSLTHSFPFVTPDTKAVLEELGQAYAALAGEGNFFTVSSATRTESQQKALKRRNKNATDGNSSHSYGISFDISYIRFNGIRGWDGKAQQNLEKVLNHFQQTGKIYVIKERRQSCYHVTVR